MDLTDANLLVRNPHREERADTQVQETMGLQSDHQGIATSHGERHSPSLYKSLYPLLASSIPSLILYIRLRTTPPKDLDLLDGSCQKPSKSKTLGSFPLSSKYGEHPTTKVRKWAVLTASRDEVVQAIPDQTGPGGKPLPRNTSPGAKEKTQKIVDLSPSKKLFFTWIYVAAILTFLGDAITAIIHALVDRKNNWWRWDSVVVRGVGCAMNTTTSSKTRRPSIAAGVGMVESPQSLFETKGPGAQ